MIAGVQGAQRREFWSGEEIEVLQLNIADTSCTLKLRESPQILIARSVFTISTFRRRTITSTWENCLRSAALLHSADSAKALNMLNDILMRYDPDLILSERGDSVLFPALLKVAKIEKLRLLLDRDRVITKRQIETEGRIEEYDLETRAALAARELIGDGVNVNPGEKIGYIITNAKAKNKAERVSTSNRNGAAHYDRQEYAARLQAATKEVGVIGNDDLSEEPGRAGANQDLLFPI